MVCAVVNFLICYNYLVRCMTTSVGTCFDIRCTHHMLKFVYSYPGYTSLHVVSTCSYIYLISFLPRIDIKACMCAYVQHVLKIHVHVELL